MYMRVIFASFNAKGNLELFYSPSVTISTTSKELVWELNFLSFELLPLQPSNRCQTIC